MSGKNRIKIGDHCIIWRSRFAPNDSLLGKRVVIIDISKDYRSWGAYVITPNGDIEQVARSKRYTVFVLETEEVITRVDPRCVQKVPRIECVSSWNDCVFIPVKLK